MEKLILIHKPLPQNPDIWVSIPNYKEPILPVSGGFGWYGLQAYDFQGDKLMCHECGEFRDSLGGHIKLHKLTPTQYKEKYGLLKRTVLVSHKEKERLSQQTKHMLENPNYRRWASENGRRALSFVNQDNRTKGVKSAYNSLEFQNSRDTCSAQTLRWLEQASKVFGENVTAVQVENIKPGLLSLCQDRFGSFNKAKQILRLKCNAVGYPINEVVYTKQIILEDMCGFYRKYKKWPKLTDYKKGFMICSSVFPLYRFGGIKALCQEAQQLKDEQDKRNDIDINTITNRIELENAGKSRR